MGKSALPLMPGADSDGSPLLPPQRSDILLSFPFLLKKKGGGKGKKKEGQRKEGKEGGGRKSFENR